MSASVNRSCHCNWRLLVLIAFAAAFEGCVNTNTLTVHAHGASVNTTTSARRAGVHGDAVMNITNAATASANGNRTPAPESVNSETFVRDSSLNALKASDSNTSNNVLNSTSTAAVGAALAEETKTGINTNETFKVDNHSAKPSPRSKVDAEADDFNVLQLKEPFGTATGVANLDDYSYREIIEDWASSILKPNRTRARTPASNANGSNGQITTDATAGDGDSFNFNETAGAVGNKRRSGKKRRSVCRISEFSCARGNKCISSDKYCDTVDDCGDRSDEPASCTPCNRTYYGEWGSTYSLSLSSESIFGGHGVAGADGAAQRGGGGSAGAGRGGAGPQFVCQLTFAAAGDNFGDLVQVMFDSINIGHYSSSMLDGCPEGSLQVAEISRPVTGGSWCGSGSGLSVYYSEMSAIALTLSIGGGGKLLSAPTSKSKMSQKAATANSTFSSYALNETGGELVGAAATPSQNPIQTSSRGEMTVISGGSSAQPSPLEFDFKIRYKFIPKSLAVVRYGLPSAPIDRGELVPGTYCSRVLDSCHRRRCKIQSPNYPGLYPRNVSCYFTIRQREIPPCKKVLIQVIQLKPHKVQLRSIPNTGRLAPGLVPASTLQDPTASLHDSFLAWEDCAAGNRDGLIIYDGTTTDDPVLLKICGGSYIPPITSSGAGLLIAFHSTPFGNPLEPKPPAPYPTPLRGFELDVDVVVVDSLSADYSNHKNCTFYFTSQKPNDGDTVTGPDDDLFSYTKYHAQEFGGNWIAGKMGSVKSPRHTLPPNTTCRYEFRGSKHENVWIYFVSYRRVLIKDSKEVDGNCTTRLRIMDGLDSRNEVRLATYCDNELPKLCDHRTLENETRVVRACTINESFISAGSRLIVEQQFLEGTALRHLHYHFNYEFVSRHTGDGTCNRRWHSSKMRSHGSFRTTDNVFDFGRGGRRNVSCTYTVVLGTLESFQLTIRNSSFGQRGCTTRFDLEETGRYTCQYDSSPTTYGRFGGPRSHPKSEMRLYEYIWPSANVSAHEHCICGNDSGQTFLFLGRKVEFVFTVENMKSDESYENFFVEFDYRVHRGGGCRPDNHHEMKKRMGGIIALDSTFVRGVRDRLPTCDTYPWLLQGTDSHSLYLRIPGFAMMEERSVPTLMTGSNRTSDYGLQIPLRPPLELSCRTTNNRIFIYDGENKLVQKICPSSYQIGSGTAGSTSGGSSGRKLGQTVEIYSSDFHQFNSPLYSSPLKSTFVIEFVGRELGSYRIHWLEVMSARMKIALQTMERDERRMGEAAKAAAGAGGATTNVVGNTTLMLDKKVILEDPLFKSMFENGETVTTVGGDGIGNFVHLVGGSATISETIAPCPFYCPELNACINEKLWCDGETHCPISEADEKSCDSFWLTVRQLMSPTVYIPIAAAVVSAIICCMLVLTCLGLKRLIIVKTTSSLQRHQQRGGVDSSGRRIDPGRRGVPRDFLIDARDPNS